MALTTFLPCDINFSLTFVLMTILFMMGYWYLAIPPGIPPGPRGLPIVGYLPFLGERPHETLDKLAKKFGPVFSLYFGHQLVIVLNDYESIREAFVKQAEIFAGRPKNMAFNIQEPDQHTENKKRHVDGHRNHYVAAYIGEQKMRQEKLKDDDVFTDQALEENMRTLMAAGTETTANTLRWIILYMMAYPEVQKKVQAEIDEVIGTDRSPSWSDRGRTPYIEAAIYEVQRMSTLVPLNVPHRNKEACEVLGHKIPKDSFIVTNLWAVHNDPKIWGDPENFRPERFLAGNGEALKSEHLIPFSLGKRQCPGEILARMELYLYFTAMLQKFTFQAPKGTVPSLEPSFAITVTPKTFITVPVLRSVS